MRVLIDERGIERAVLMSHSWGGTIVTAFAGAYPERVDGLVLVDSGQMDYQDAPAFRTGRSYAELVEDAWPAIAEEGIPILLLLATEPEDTLELNGQAAGPFAERFPDAEIHYLADAGHDLFADAGPELARIVADWAERLPPR